MAWAYVQTFETVTWDEYERVGRELGDETPEGAILHAAGPYGGSVRVIEVWESMDAFDRFRDERLVPAVVRALGEERAAEGPGRVEVLDVQNLLIGAR
jgi:hypothetical protein